MLGIASEVFPQLMKPMVAPQQAAEATKAFGGRGLPT